MSDTFEYAARPGNTALSLATFAGLSLLTSQLWPIMPGYVLLLFLPALAITFAQMVLIPTWGMRIGDTTWQIEAGHEARSVPVAQIAYLRINDRTGPAQVAVILTSGEAVPLPVEALPDPLTLIREATSRGIPVRHA
ncbi:hypothetical protein roselon_03325 [Roseibacterium elongatum DSM 19469]|uniref:DUF304 domain-containing protein n=1 Tax=Roseicyclus elongatus DSM 19469 TaxID=1294273 RepID=W8RW90_9RHOB|nr:hypothetical protein [Roseibacterium elongatum]AHM05583.1 hypothetical protein roselon_03325 [Roseibacterium elongatum DSM 19469]